MAFAWNRLCFFTFYSLYLFYFFYFFCFSLHFKIHSWFFLYLGFGLFFGHHFCLMGNNFRFIFIMDRLIGFFYCYFRFWRIFSSLTWHNFFVFSGLWLDLTLCFNLNFGFSMDLCFGLWLQCLGLCFFLSIDSWSNLRLIVWMFLFSLLLAYHTLFFMLLSNLLLNLLDIMSLLIYLWGLLFNYFIFDLVYFTFHHTAHVLYYLASWLRMLSNFLMKLLLLSNFR